MDASPVPAEVIAAKPQPAAQVNALQKSRTDKMREYFKNRPKEKIRIRPSDGEQWVQINGYAFRIQAGAEVSVPTDVADLLRIKGVL